MATYELPISSPLTETGDDVYCKPTDTSFSGVGWGTSCVAATEISDTNVYLATLDETKGYLVYLNGTSNTFTASAGTDAITDNSHGLLDGETLRFKGTDLPAGLEQTTLYYVRDATTNTFKVALTGGGAAVDITDAGSGVMVYVAPVQRSKSADVYLGAVPIVNAGTISSGEESAIAEAVATRLGVASADIDTHLHAIQAKTDLIMAGGVISGDSVVSNKTIIRLTRNDAYNGTSNAAKTFTVTKDYTTGWTGVFTIRHRTTDAVLITKAVTITSSVLLTVTLTSTDTAFTGLTAAEDFGPHPFDIEMTGTGNKQTPVQGIAIITKDSTYT